jgi:hypothetical protein
MTTRSDVPDMEPTGEAAEGPGTDCDCEGGCSDEDFETGGVPTVDVPAPDTIVELCAQCVQYVRRAVGVILDFTPETLPVVDHYLALVRTSTQERLALLTLVANSIGAYFGEVVRQRINGFWLMPSPDVHDWLVCGRSVFFRFNPIGVVYEAIAQAQDHTGPSGEIKLAREDQAFIAERLAVAPTVPADQFYLLSTRLEAIDIVVETLRLAMDNGGQESVEFEPSDYEFD